MTLIIGWRAREGVVIAADSKEIRGGEPSFGNKIFEKAGVAIAAEGLTGIRDDFLLLLDYEIARVKGFGTLYEVKVVVEDIVANLSTRYSDRIKQELPVGVLLGGLERLNDGKAQLYYVHGVGYGEAVEFMVTGSGGPYATALAKFLYDRKLDLEESAYRAAFIISWVSEKVDVGVGGTPNVAMIHDNEPTIRYLNKSTLEDAGARCTEVQNQLAELFGFTKRKLTS